MHSFKSAVPVFYQSRDSTLTAGKIVLRHSTEHKQEACVYLLGLNSQRSIGSPSNRKLMCISWVYNPARSTRGLSNTKLVCIL